MMTVLALLSLLAPLLSHPLPQLSKLCWLKSSSSTTIQPPRSTLDWLDCPDDCPQSLGSLGLLCSLLLISLCLNVKEQKRRVRGGVYPSEAALSTCGLTHTSKLHVETQGALGRTSSFGQSCAVVKRRFSMRYARSIGNW